MKKLLTICVLTALVGGCDKKNPSPQDYAALLASSQAGRVNQQPQVSPPVIAPASTNLSNQTGPSNDRLTCRVCHEKCGDGRTGTQWSMEKDPICKTCVEQIAGCDDTDYTYYREDLAGLSQQDLQRMDAYPNFQMFNGPTGMSQFNPWSGPGGGFQFQSNYFRQNAPMFNRVPCGNRGYRQNCNKENTIYFEHFRRCKKIQRALDHAAKRADEGATAEEVRLELVRIESDVKQVSRKSQIEGRFTGLLSRLKDAGKNILVGMGEAAIGVAEGVATGVANRATAVGDQSTSNLMGRIQGLSQGMNYLAGQNPDSPCDPVECEDVDSEECIMIITQFKINCN